MQPTFITHEWVRLIRNTSLPRLRFHDLRHAHATHLLSSGVHPKIASERLGHSKVGITIDLYSQKIRVQDCSKWLYHVRARDATWNGQCR